ncbi:polypeptide N-acetylgalactosaminyltransferase 1 isoform X1 [Cloeon dipterum]|uniref:polypeptide N-acetylgalactosaminyltransferase 1 isoform X1 n=1 Tax=Cloeon dipterum TaxID=197152 RepID=UPI00321FEAFD
MFSMFGHRRRRKWASKLLFAGLFFGIVILWLSTRSSSSVEQKVIIREKYVQAPAPTQSDVPLRYEQSALTDQDYEAMIAQDEARIIPGLGDEGAACELEDPEELALAEKLMAKEAFNIVLSNKISLTRTVPDARHPMCKNQRFSNNLPSASVVIIFTNEAWSTLMRTVHSVLNHSPPHLLKEIVLVDDFSDREELHGKLEYYLRTRLPADKVKLVRLPERSGLIRARLAGARAASADVLIFLDSHCEVVVQWLEPLLQRIKESRTSVLIPIIDVISEKNFEYSHVHSENFEVGGFTWSGHFTWIHVPEEEKIRRGSAIGATRSPTMAGGLFAIDRNYFWEVGSYDEQMDVWGGENLEMSFRVWMCGGSLEVMPCSRVGHIFRPFHPYTFPGGKDTHGINTARVVEVWMDDYKRLFYMHRSDLQTIDIGDISARRKFREKMKCKSFKWFLDNVYPSKYIPDEDVIAYGRVRNEASTPNFCFDNLNHDSDSNYNLGIYGCHNNLETNQLYSLSKKGELRREFNCVQAPATKSLSVEKAMLVPCHDLQGNQEWEWNKRGQLKHKASGKCIDIENVHSEEDVKVAPCSDSKFQVFQFEHVLIPPTS